jgi:hypothetical protein
LRVGQDRQLADAADRLVKAGGTLADKASSWSGAFSRADREFSRRVQEFRGFGERQRRSGVFRRLRR